MTCTALVLGAGGFIGSHMVRRLKSEGYWVRGVDLKRPEFSSTEADEFIQGDLTDPLFVEKVIRYTGKTGNFFKQDVPSKYWHPFHEIYQFAADMGGAGFIFTGENDAEIMHNSATINLNLLHEQKKLNNLLDRNYTKIFYSSSACMYPAFHQETTEDPKLPESLAYPAQPDSEYGWEKLFSERLYLTFNRNHAIPVRVARYHNIFGPEGTWKGGREKAPAAICRKVSEATSGDAIEVWGDGKQTRSFLFIDECIEATRRLMKGDFIGPVNIGSEEMVSIDTLVDIAGKVSGKTINKNHIPDSNAIGVRGRNSCNDLIREKLGWDYEQTLEEGIRKTYEWIVEQNPKATEHERFEDALDYEENYIAG
tara:strand:+ start:466 stop:1566 length:1101 start_codon:yes stop_codon:yes gene_type:complete